jgi:hypothetical protein
VVLGMTTSFTVNGVEWGVMPREGSCPVGGVAPGALPVDRATCLWTLPSWWELNPRGRR